MANSNFQLNFTGIGAPKAGTTSVADWLAEHPQVCFAEPKEPHYFNEISAYIHPQPNNNFSKKIDWYAKHFAHTKPNQIKGEFSTGYMYDKEVAKRLYEHNSNLKIIACLRHPAERAYSQYVMFRYYFKKEMLDFDEAMVKRPEFIDKSKYFNLLKPYLEIFPKEQIKIILLDDINKNAQAVYSDLCQFLTIDKHFIPKSLNTRSNSAKAVKAPVISKIMGIFTNVMVSVGLSKVVEQLKKTGFKDWVIKQNSKKLDYPPMSNFARKFITEQTYADIEKLEKLLNRDLSHWKK